MQSIQLNDAPFVGAIVVSEDGTRLTGTVATELRLEGGPVEAARAAHDLCGGGPRAVWGVAEASVCDMSDEQIAAFAVWVRDFAAGVK